MAVKTTLEQLEEVQAAISAVCSGQAYSMSSGGSSRTMTRADLDALTKREETLLARYKSESGTGGMAINTGIIKRDY
jgi:hypothetical protein